MYIEIMTRWNLLLPRMLSNISFSISLWLGGGFGEVATVEVVFFDGVLVGFMWYPRLLRG